ncbi:MAG: NAD(P)/FAD-dependent oxidoreductase [Thermodesulfovibrionales bacterium]|nr:NAD(P)/FAD-dependent oxidoreductase [Thermodesulfovibrionales bacterium]
MHDAVVIGAGPIGCYTAYQLAREGFDVLVLEKNGSFTHPPACTGIIGVEAFERFNLPEDSILSSIRDILFFSPSGLALTFCPGSTQAFVVDRIKFDRRLRELALKNGASIRLGTSCKEIQIKDTHVEIGVSGTEENIKAKAVVIASGFNRRLSENLGLGNTSDYIQGVQTEVKVEGVKETRVYVGNDIAPGSFAWVVGLENGRARIGLTTKHNASIFLRRFLENPLLRGKIKEKGAILYKLIPIGSLKRTYSDRMLVVGEAAGLVKTTTHGGIYYGLISSQLAVETLKEAFRRGDFGSRIMKRYEGRWRERLGAEIKTGYRLRRFFSHLRDEQIDKFFKIAMNDGVMDIVYQKVRFDWHGNLIFSLVRHSPIKKYFSKWR